MKLFKTRNTNSLNFKHKILALFQFFSMVGVIFLLLSMFLISYTINDFSATNIKYDFKEWMTQIKISITFSELKTTGILAGISFYVFLALWTISNLIALLMVKFKNRNLFDQLFLVFIIFPIMSNIFALFSQLSSKTIQHTEASFDKEKIIEDQTKIIKMAFKNSLKEKKARKKSKK